MELTCACGRIFDQPDVGAAGSYLLAQESLGDGVACPVCRAARHEGADEAATSDEAADEVLEVDPSGEDVECDFCGEPYDLDLDEDEQGTFWHVDVCPDCREEAEDYDGPSVPDADALEEAWL